ncbi:Uncharacterised protein [Vibrio cholerae]|nr:Uncharacterised protein [Vibrio cholerae]
MFETQKLRISSRSYEGMQSYRCTQSVGSRTLQTINLYS